MIEQIDIDVIEMRYKDWVAVGYPTAFQLAHEMPALIAEVRRLRTELSKMVQAHNDVFNEWEKASGEAVRATELERQRWIDALEQVYRSAASEFNDIRYRMTISEVCKAIKAKAIE